MRLTAILAVLVALAPVARADGLPISMGHAGHLLGPADEPVNDPALSLRFRLYDVELPIEAQVLVWEATCTVTVVRGFYGVTLGAGDCAGTTTLDSSDLPVNVSRFLEVSVGELALLPRLRVSGSPWAAVALDSEKLGGIEASKFARTDLLTQQSFAGAITAPAFAGDGSALSDVDAATLEGNSVADLDARYVRASGGTAGNVTISGALTAGSLNAGVVTAGRFEGDGSAIMGLAGDVTGSLGANRVEKLGGIALPQGSPATGQVLWFDGNSWTYSGLTGAFVHNGNAFGTAATLGTNDSHDLNLETANTVRMTITGAGDVGVGTTSPTASVETTGGLRVGNDAGPCNAGRTGTFKFASGEMWICDGAAWKIVSLLPPVANVVQVGGTGYGMDVVVGGNPAYGSPETFTYQNIGGASTVAMTTSLTNTTNFEITADTCAGAVLVRNATCSVTVRPRAWTSGPLVGSRLDLNW